jgi:hypothetical protein
MRIIGIELRVKYVHPKFGLRQKEIAIIPCDVTVQIEGEQPYCQSLMNATIHTDQGDIGIQDFQIPFSLHDSNDGLLFRSLK